MKESQLTPQTVKSSLELCLTPKVVSVQHTVQHTVQHIESFSGVRKSFFFSQVGLADSEALIRNTNEAVCLRWGANVRNLGEFLVENFNERSSIMKTSIEVYTRPSCENQDLNVF